MTRLWAGQHRHQNLILDRAQDIFPSPKQWVCGALSPGIRWPEHESDHSPPSSAQVKSNWSYTTFPHDVTVCTENVPFPYCITTSIYPALYHCCVWSSFTAPVVVTSNSKIQCSAYLFMYSWPNWLAPTVVPSPGCWSHWRADGTPCPYHCWWWSCQRSGHIYLPFHEPFQLCLWVRPPENKKSPLSSSSSPPEDATLFTFLNPAITPSAREELKPSH